jgi:hypothetical protein
MSEAAGGYRFLSGAAMDPQLILATYPGARFVARVRLPVSGSDAPGDEVWGIVIRLATPATSDSDAVREVTTDDGRTLTAAVAGDGHPTGDPAAVLAAAKYWELSPAYVKRLSGAR